MGKVKVSVTTQQMMEVRDQKPIQKEITIMAA